MNGIPVPTFSEVSEMFTEACKKSFDKRCDLFEPLPSPPKIKRSTSPSSYESEGFAPSSNKDQDSDSDESLKDSIPGWDPAIMDAHMESYFKHNPEHPSAGLWEEFKAKQKKEAQQQQQQQ